MQNYTESAATSNATPSKPEAVTMRPGFEGVRAAWELAGSIACSLVRLRQYAESVQAHVATIRADLAAGRSPEKSLAALHAETTLPILDASEVELYAPICGTAEALLLAAGVDIGAHWKTHADLLREMLPHSVTVLGAELTEHRGPHGETVAVSVDGQAYVRASPGAGAALAGKAPM